MILKYTNNMLSMLWLHRVQKYLLQLFADLNMLDMTMLVYVF